MRLKDKIVVVTGSSAGIGEETAELFADRGSKVVVTYHSGEEEGRETFDRCKKHSEAMLTQLDGTDKDSIRAALDNIKDKFGTPDILVNNAGIQNSGKLINISHEDIEDQIEVNLTGLINMTKIFLDEMLEKEEGLVINIGSGLGKSGMARVATYSATKFGVRGFTQSLAGELPNGFRTYVVNPGMTATRMTDYKGTEPKNVADVIVRTAEEDLNKRSGDDVDVKDHY